MHRPAYDRILVAYADCGTGGLLDAVLDEEGVERIEGPHCYAFYTGRAAFDALAEAETGTFYLTDYMVRHFDRLIVQGLGLDRHPELRDDYFRHYTRCLYIAPDPRCRLSRSRRGRRRQAWAWATPTAMSAMASWRSS